ncbi:MAG: hypothetical protein QW709_06645 [Thermoplasmata archaeon]
MIITIKHGKDRMIYFVKYSGHIYELGFLSLQNTTEEKRNMVKEIFQENKEYDLINFIHALGLIKIIRTHEGVDYSNTIKIIKNVLNGIKGVNGGENEQIERI